MQSGGPCPTRALWRSENGVAAVEFALVVPVLVLLLAGAISFGVAFRMKMEVGNAARAGAAYASAHGFNLSGITAAARNATALSAVTVAAAQATTSCVDPATGAINSGNSDQACPGTGSPPGAYVTVTTRMPYTFILAVPGIGDSTTLTGHAVARIQ